LGKGIFIALLNPAISAIFAGGFYLLWRHQRERPYIAMLAAAYLASACGFMVQYFTLPIGLAPTKVLSNVLFFATAYTMAVGVLGRFGRRPPHPALSLLAGGGILAFSWFVFIEPDPIWRTLVVNFALAGMSLVIAAELRQVAGKLFIDRLLTVFIFANGITFLLRPLAVVAVDGFHTSGDDLFMSLYWISTSVSHAFFSVLVAICLITAIALDVIGKLKSDSVSDSLSGLLNRRGFEERVNEILARSSLSGVPAALVLADLDRFKSINDTYGHACGDRVIAAFGKLLREAAGQEGVAGRIGGEEFAIVLPGSGLGGARLFAEGVRVSFGAATITGVPAGVSFTASFGVTEAMERDTLSALFSRADIALYQAKHDGRNRVRAVSGTVTMAQRRLRRPVRTG